jgi:hypothetical protein
MLDGDNDAEWLTPNGVQLHNAGSWVFSQTFLASGNSQSPYWPGSAILIDNGAPPHLLHLLADRPAGELSGVRGGGASLSSG